MHTSGRCRCPKTWQWDAPGGRSEDPQFAAATGQSVKDKIFRGQQLLSAPDLEAGRMLFFVQRRVHLHIAYAPEPAAAVDHLRAGRRPHHPFCAVSEHQLRMNTQTSMRQGSRLMQGQPQSAPSVSGRPLPAPCASELCRTAIHASGCLMLPIALAGADLRYI